MRCAAPSHSEPRPRALVAADAVVAGEPRAVSTRRDRRRAGRREPAEHFPLPLRQPPRGAGAAAAMPSCRSIIPQIERRAARPQRRAASGANRRRRAGAARGRGGREGGGREARAGRRRLHGGRAGEGTGRSLSRRTRTSSSSTRATALPGSCATTITTGRRKLPELVDGAEARRDPGAGRRQ